ncbi:hypothetical protein [Salinigranum salinum]|uniref:hypothetical protein n=1 Tax=Salinigranum salinum TaxID=1364937 RepID=UPI001260AB73|nr:hypothetical protein [Salinigranum salinum]
MAPDWLDPVAREVGEFLRFVLLWAGLGPAVVPLQTVVGTLTGGQAPRWLVPVGAAVAATAVYWVAGRVSWRLVGRVWVVGIAVAVLSAVGFVFLSLDAGTGLVTGAVVLGWWLLSLGLAVVLTSPTAWRRARDRVLVRPRS